MKLLSLASRVRGCWTARRPTISRRTSIFAARLQGARGRTWTQTGDWTPTRILLRRLARKPKISCFTFDPAIFSSTEKRTRSTGRCVQREKAGAGVWSGLVRFSVLLGGRICISLDGPNLESPCDSRRRLVVSEISGLEYCNPRAILGTRISRVPGEERIRLQRVLHAHFSSRTHDVSRSCC